MHLDTLSQGLSTATPLHSGQHSVQTVTLVCSLKPPTGINYPKSITSSGRHSAWVFSAQHHLVMHHKVTHTRPWLTPAASALDSLPPNTNFIFQLTGKLF